MSFLLLSVCLDELFFLSGSTFLVHYKVLNKQPPSANFVFKLLYYVTNSNGIKNLPHFYE